MPLRLDLEKIVQIRSERVKCVELHSQEPWALVALYTGQVLIYDYERSAVLKQFEVSDQPVRCARFIERKSWVIVAADDLFVRVYNYNTMEKVREFEAHQDYVRAVAVHPTRPVFLTASDDMLIKLWDWERNWSCNMVYEGHSHYVMQVVFNPKDPNTFASASLDCTVKIWNLTSPVPNMSLEGHRKGVNCVDYYPGNDRPYLISGGDDERAIIWDMQTRTPVQELLGHTANVSAVRFHPTRPLILTAGEDGSVRIWNSNTYRLETILSYGLDRCWSLACLKSSGVIAIGYDLGTVVARIGKDDPVYSMDQSGKVILAKHNEIFFVALRQAGAELLSDGERISAPMKEMGTTEMHPQAISHSPNGRFIAVCGDGEYTIYTALAWRNKSFGAGDELVWDNGPGEYAVREGSARVRVFNRAQKERAVVRTPFPIKAIYGGPLLGISGEDCVCFYDWTSLQIVQRIDVAATNVIWSDTADLLAIVTVESFFIVQYNRAAVDAHIEAHGGELGTDGVDSAFSVLHEFADRVLTGRWSGECFIFSTASNRLCFLVGTEVASIAHLERPMYLLGYLPAENRIYLVDRNLQIVSYTLLASIVQFKILIKKELLSESLELLKSIPKSEYNRLAQSLEKAGYKEAALQVATDSDYRFELALSLNKLDVAREIAEAAPGEARWRQLVDAAIASKDLELAERCMLQSHDISSLLLLYVAQGNVEGIQRVAQDAVQAGELNAAFLCKLLLHDRQGCLDLLVRGNRAPEAALFARTFLPSRVPEMVQLWKKSLQSSGESRAAGRIADPEHQPELFSSWSSVLEKERLIGGAMNGTVAGDRDKATDLGSLFEEAGPRIPDLTRLALAKPASPEESKMNLAAARSETDKVQPTFFEDASQELQAKQTSETEPLESTWDVDF
ncbi:hypothetical protein CCYA_CCYA07G2212 [Cyanidiococcus yangmingshanensis]|nr:hypothetical protein CCYA_CCYA07G2212 [Cyanidiococcus yangmingshanensis]